MLCTLTALWLVCACNGRRYDHYEVSNYAKPGKQCAHNLVYWRNQEYYAFGMVGTMHMDIYQIDVQTCISIVDKQTLF